MSHTNIFIGTPPYSTSSVFVGSGGLITNPIFTGIGGTTVTQSGNLVLISGGGGGSPASNSDGINLSGNLASTGATLLADLAATGTLLLNPSQVNLGGATGLALNTYYFDSFTGVNRIVGFLGQPPTQGSFVTLRALVSGQCTLQFPVSNRVGQGGTVTGLTLNLGTQEIDWVYANSNWWMIDSTSAINNTNATRAPLTTDDSTSGYAAGSTWINGSTLIPYICISPTSGAAVWTNISGGAGNSFTSILLSGNVITANNSTLYLNGVAIVTGGGGGGGSGSNVSVNGGSTLSTINLVGAGNVSFTVAGSTVTASGNSNDGVNISGNLTTINTSIAITTGNVGLLTTDLTATGVTLLAKIATLSGYDAATYATLTSLTSTGVTLGAAITTLSGYDAATYATQAALAATGTALSAVRVTGSSTINLVNLAGLNTITVFTSGTQTFISGASENRLVDVITQTGYNGVTLSGGQLVLPINGTWQPARADRLSTAAVGYIESTGGGVFNVVYAGYCAINTGFTVGSTLYLSDATSGVLTATAPSATGSFLQPLIYVGGTGIGYMIPSWPTALSLITNVNLAAMPALTVKANVTSVGASPADVSVQTLLNVIGSGQGTLMEYGASGWTGLAPSANVGFVLTSNGVGADPSYQATTGATIAQLNATGALLGTAVTTLSGYDAATYSTITNLTATGAGLSNRLVTLSGYDAATYATAANLALTGSNLYALINAASAGVSSINGQSGALTLQSSGYLTFATGANSIVFGLTGVPVVTVTGSNPLVNPSFSGFGGTIVFLSGNQVLISGGAGGGGAGGIATANVSGALFTAIGFSGNNAIAAETSIIGAGVGNLTLPAGYFAAGSNLMVIAEGIYSTAISVASLNVKLKADSTILGQTTAQSLVASQTNSPWTLYALLTCQSTGTTGQFALNAIFEADTSTLALTSVGMVNTGTFTLDTTSAHTIGLTATWGAATAGDSITTTNFTMFSPGVAALPPIAPGTVYGNNTAVSAAPLGLTASAVLDMVGSGNGAALGRAPGGWQTTTGASGTYLQSNGTGLAPSFAPLAIQSGQTLPIGNIAVFQSGIATYPLLFQYETGWGYRAIQTSFLSKVVSYIPPLNTAGGGASPIACAVSSTSASYTLANQQVVGAGGVFAPPTLTNSFVASYVAQVATSSTSAFTKNAYRGSQPGYNGFFYSTRFGFTGGSVGEFQNPSGLRFMAGLIDSPGVSTFFVPGPATGNSIPTGHHYCGLNYMWATGGAGGTLDRYYQNFMVTTADGTNEFTGNSTMSFNTGVYRFTMYCQPYPNNGFIQWQLDDLLHKTGCAGTMTNNLPSGQIGLVPFVAFNNISGGPQKTPFMIDLYLETP